MNINKKVGAELRALRIEHGFDQIELSVEIDRARSSISEDELGARKITLTILERYLDFYQISFSDFFSLIDSRK